VKHGLWVFVSVAVAVVSWAGLAEAQSGHTLNAVGARSMGMAGTDTASPSDAVGTLYANPAGLTAIESQVSFGFEAFASDASLTSTVDADGFGPGMPAGEWTGTTNSDAGVLPIPSMALNYHPEGARWAIGLGAYGIGGFGVDYAVDMANPILSPQPSQGGAGFGGIYSNFQIMQIAPSFAYDVTDWLAVGVSATVDWASLSVSPFPAASPDNSITGDPSNPADPANMPSYSTARGASCFGFGFAVGLRAKLPAGLRLGLSAKSPQWLGNFVYNSTGEAGGPRRFDFDMDYPMILQAGLAYEGLDWLKVAMDFRYIDYEHTDGFSDSGFDNTGAVRGFGWKSIYVVSLGTEVRPTEWLSLRAGYSYNPAPIESDMMFFNTPASALIEHQIYGGVGVAWEAFRLDIGVRHGFENSVTGPYASADPTRVPSARVKASLATTSAALSIGMQY